VDWDSIQATSYWQWLLAHQDWLGWLVFALAFVESFAIIGILVPGVVLLAAAAFIAGSGALDLFPTLVCAAGGAIAGDSCSFMIGRYFHRHLPHIWPFRLHQSWLDRGEQFFIRYGILSILVGRFIGPIRPVMPLVAGSLFMPGHKFLAINLTSAFLWAPVYILPGYFAGSAMDYPQLSKSYIIGAVVFLLLAGTGLIWLRRQFHLEPE
jgi:undecaprenyl-diphosphatase